MALEDERDEHQGAHSGENRTMKLIGIGAVILILLFVLVLATGLGEMAPWDGGDASNTAQ